MSELVGRTGKDLKRDIVTELAGLGLGLAGSGSGGTPMA